MAKDEIEEMLLSELDNCIWFVMSKLADRAQETGDASLANGWRWLAENRKFPASRVLDTSWNGKNEDKKFGWGWTIVDSVHYQNRQSSALPAVVRSRMAFAKSSSLPKLLQHTARALGQWLEEDKP